MEQKFAVRSQDRRQDTPVLVDRGWQKPLWHSLLRGVARGWRCGGWEAEVGGVGGEGWRVRGWGHEHFSAKVWLHEGVLQVRRVEVSLATQTLVRVDVVT